MRRLVVPLAIGALLAAAAGSGRAAEGDVPIAPECVVPPALMVVGAALPRGAVRVEEHRPLTIVAIGSSSTLGVGASTPALSYPARLAAELNRRLPNIPVTMINRGRGGEDVAEELARLDRDAIALNPDLVIWQLGTNAVLRRDDISADHELVQRGVGLLKEHGSDVVLMDLQYAPRVIARPAFAAMEEMIARVARRARVGLFRRFDIMRYWREVQAADAAMMIGPDGLHMTDRSYGCLAENLAEALTRNWSSHLRVARQPPGARVAGLPPQQHNAVEPDDFSGR